jgi:CarD family transcriptional regulator
MLYRSVTTLAGPGVGIDLGRPSLSSTTFRTGKGPALLRIFGQGVRRCRPQRFGAAVTQEKGTRMASNAPAFIVGDYVVYPKHGVGRVIELQSEEIAGMQLELYVLRFEKERMTLRVPVNKVESIGMRKLSSDKTLKEAIETLKGKPKVKRTMWSRRAQEYEAKINSGDLVSIAEVTRDLFRPEDQPEQSYSERQIFEAASSRLARELAAMEETDEPTALEKILDVLREHAPQYYENAEES